MKNIITLLFSFLLIQHLQCQNQCLPNGIGFLTQEAIDSFPLNYPDCSKIIGSVWIGGEEPTGITNLNGLSLITSVGGSLSIMHCPDLKSMTGLQNLTIIDGFLFVAVNDSLNDITALSSLSAIGGSFDFHGNDQMINLEGLNALESIGFNVWVSGNERLSNFHGLGGLKSIGGYLWINFNDSLNSLEGLDNIEPASIGYLLISHNPLLTGCHLESICNYLSDPSGVVEILANAPGCNSPAEILEACFSGTEASFITPEITIWPNPSESGNISFKINNVELNLHITCFNAFGQEVYDQEVYASETVVDVRNWQPGIYLCVLYKDRKPIGRAKFVVLNRL